MPGLLRAWLHLAVLWAFAFAKPLFDVLADSPEFFVARGNTRADILIFAIGMVVVPPTVLVLVEAAVSRLPRIREALHLVFVGGLFAVFAVQLLDDAIGGGGAVAIALAVLLGAGVALAYQRTELLPSMLTVLSPAPLLFLLLFLVGSDVSKLVLPQDESRAAGVEVRSDVPVVFLVFDEFDSNLLMNSRHRIDAERYPNLAALARDSTWYPNATTVNSQTTLAVPALLSGRRPTPDLLPIPADYPNNLFTLLGRSHDVHASETATEVCPEKLCGGRTRESLGGRLRSLGKDLGIVSLHLVAPERMEADLPAVDQTFGDFGGGGKDAQPAHGQPDVPLSALTNRPAEFKAFFDEMSRERERPGLFFLHAALPHIPWQYLPGGQQYVNAGPDYPGLQDERWSSDPFPPRLGLQRHLLQAGFADLMVGRMIARLRRAGVYDKAMIVITADHGVSFRPGEPRRSPSPDNISDIASMPLMIKYPGRPGGRLDPSFVRTIDVVPTIAAELGVELPWKADGRPIGEGGSDDGEVAVRAGSTDQVVRLGFRAFVRRHDAGLQRILFTFGEGRRNLYANGSDAELLGRAVSDIGRAPAADARLRLDDATQLNRFRAGSHLVPSFISGTVEGDLKPHQTVAMAVNGTIRGLTETFSYEGGMRLAAIVPATSFRTGSNSVQPFALTGPPGRRRLAPIQTERPESYRLVDDGSAIEGAGRRIALKDGAVEGFVDSFQPDDQGTRISGWAVAHAARRPADLILVFVDGRLVAQAGATLTRADIAANLGAGAARSGFEVRVLPVAGAEADDFRVFAVRGDEGSELPRYGG